jgi:hypothetical protein
LKLLKSECGEKIHLYEVGMIARLIEAPESDTCRQILEGKLWTRTYLTIERRQALGPYELNQKNET